MIKYRKIWFNPAWKEGADSELYGDGGFYEKADELSMAKTVCSIIQELGYWYYFAGSPILDYGGGNGALCEYIENHIPYTAPALYDPITSPKMPAGKFPIVTCVHVIEHAKDPIKLIQDIKAKLVPGGLLFLVCHNVVGWPNKRAREPWHRWLFGEEIVQLIEAEGFELKARLTWGGCTAKAKWIKEPINWLRKKLGVGDVQMVIMERI